MKENRYTLPEEQSCDMVSEPLIATSTLADLKNQLVERVMNIENTETLQSLIIYIDHNVLPESDTFEEEWNRSIPIEEFRARCKSKLKAMYGKV